MKLIDICELIADCPHSTAKNEGQGFPLIRTPNIGKGRLILDGVHRVCEKVYNERNKRAVPQPGDLILAREAPVGNVAIIQENQKVCLGQRTVLIRPKTKFVDANYLTYYLLTPAIQHRLTISANGATVSHLNMAEIRKINVELPSLETQTKIGRTLSLLDDRIALNQEINRNLYEQCLATYSEMFEGSSWDEDALENCTKQIIRGKSGEYVEYSKYANLNQKVNKGFILEKQYYKYLDESIDIPEEKFGRPKDIILNSLGQGTLGRVHFLFDVEDNVVIDQHISIIRTNERLTPEYLYFMLASDRYQDIINNSVAGSTGMLMLNISVVRALKIAIPPIEKQRVFSNFVEPMYAMIEKHNFENERLSELRDSLLPKLMSGELDVSELEI